MTSLVIHGHFYQPPRENPWTDVLERQPSAHPDHDWNARIQRECYRANAFARIYGDYGIVEHINNNYEYINFNFGPTLLSWMERADPQTYARILQADQSSLRRLGHGNAIAQVFGHAILPLCNPRDRVTQVRWGVADFYHRFGRAPESMWLAETACNDATLGTLIDARMRYVILSPYQAERVRPLVGGRPGGAPDPGAPWTEVGDGSIDPGRAYRYFHRDGSGRYLDVFFYDGPISRSLAFEGVLASSQAFVFRLKQGAGGPGRLVHVATDGESYGHHTRHGELSLAHAVKWEAAREGFEITNYAAYLERNPPVAEVEIKAGPDGEGTAWSCAHGVGRWIRDCGCHSGGREGWNQAWRGPLRAAFDLLRDRCEGPFEEEGRRLLSDPWAARDAYVELVVDPRRSRVDWLNRHGRGAWDDAGRERALTLLELQRHLLLTYTSCAWFFSDISGIETVQVMRYAARVLDLMAQLGWPVPRGEFLDRLGQARSNLPEHGTGADIFQQQAETARVPSKRVAAHVGIMGLVDGQEPAGVEAGYRYRTLQARRQRHGRLALHTARIALEHEATLRREDFAVAALHLGGVDFYCACGGYPGDGAFAQGVERLWNRFRTGTLPQLLRVADESFGHDEFGLDALLHDGQHRVSRAVYGNLVARFADQMISMFESNQRLIEMLQEAGLELPEELVRAAEFTYARRFEDEIARAHGSFEPGVYDRALEIAAEIKRRAYNIDTRRAGRLFGHTLATAVSAALAQPAEEAFAAATALASVGTQLGLDSNLSRAQELVYEAFETHPDWVEALRPLARAVGVKPPA